MKPTEDKEVILTEEELCEASGCAIGKKVIINTCPYSDKRGCPLFVTGVFSTKAQTAKLERLSYHKDPPKSKEANVGINIDNYADMED